MASSSETPHALPDIDVSALGRQSAAEDEGTHGSSQSDLGHGLTQHQQTMGQEPTVPRATASSAQDARGAPRTAQSAFEPQVEATNAQEAAQPHSSKTHFIAGSSLQSLQSPVVLMRQMANAMTRRTTAREEVPATPAATAAMSKISQQTSTAEPAGETKFELSMKREPTSGKHIGGSANSLGPEDANEPKLFEGFADEQALNFELRRLEIQAQKRRLLRCECERWRWNSRRRDLR